MEALLSGHETGFGRRGIFPSIHISLIERPLTGCEFVSAQGCSKTGVPGCGLVQALKRHNKPCRHNKATSREKP